ncbi:polyisoprenoid-binding protein [Chitinimonas arctica]|uniref:Polyisoprenoid-binding protein n=1 Tax=Chitinimonas arctica TaxID=2594795 RepID=A0A516SCC1_9NEIS|nr:YceI family protein [Chitinimonas arctica]QDQ25797.1 polyisoprenoid-binding protein [Chitinimonas arctica]
MSTVGKCLLAGLISCASLSAVAAPERYIVDPSHTYPSLEMSHMGLSIWRGKFNKTSGKILLDRAGKSGTVDIQIEAGSIDFGLDKMNEFAVTADWLNVAKFPTLSYRGKLRFQGEALAGVDGELTLLGNTRPVKLTVNSFKCMPHPMFKKEVCGADVEGDLNRADFGMSKYSEGEAGKIHLRIQVEAVKED